MKPHSTEESNVVISVHSDQDRQDPLPTELRENPHALAEFVRQAPVALAMFDRQMGYVAVSRLWTQTFGKGDAEVVGRSHYEVFPDLPQRWRDAHQQALGGERLSAAEVPWHRPDGSVSWHRWDLGPWRNERGDIGGVILFVENVTTPKAIDAVLRLLSVEAAGADFNAFARLATRRICAILGADMVQIAVPCPNEPGVAETIAVFAEGEPAPNYRYELAGTPCDDAMHRRVCLYPEAVCAMFPEDPGLATLEIEAYGGSALTDSHGKMLGVLSVMSRKRFHNAEMVRAVISLAGVGIGGLLQSYRAKAAVEASERFSRVLLDTMDSHIAVLNGAGEIIFANEAWFAFARHNGAEPSSVGIGTNYLRACEAGASAGPEALEMTQLLREVLSGKTDQGSREYICPTPTGDSWYRCTIKRFSDLEQAMVMVTHENVTNIRQATRRSQQVENKFRQMFDSAPDAALIVDAEGIIRMANRQAELLYQFAHDTLAGQPIRSLIRKDGETRPVALMEDFVARLSCSERGAVWGTVDGTRSDGSVFPAEVSLSRFVEDDETFYIVALRDVSLRVAAEADRLARRLAEQANQAKSVFLATMSHEIRTPLNAVLGFAEVLSHSALDTDQNALLEHMRGSAQHLLGLIDNVLDLSKIEAGEMALEGEALDLPALILDNSRALSGYATQRNVRICLFIDPSLPVHIVSDASRLRQVVYNLLGNAIKFSGGREGRGQVFVRAELVRGGEPALRLTVRDDGIGMTEAVIARLFQPFVQGEGTITRRFGGTGLGLAITKRIVERLQGEITVQSTPGAGSVFSVTVPLEPAAIQPPATPQRLKGAHCLLAESTAYIAGDLAHYLEHEGARVTRLEGRDLSAAMKVEGGGSVEVLITGPEFAVASDLPADLPRVLLCGLTTDPEAPAPGTSDRGIPASATCLPTELLTCTALAKAVQRARGHTLADTGHAPDAGARPDIAAASPRFDASQYLPILVVEDDPMNQKVILRQLALLGLEPDLAENGAVALSMLQRKSYGLILADLHMPVMDGYAMTAAIRAREAEMGTDITRSVSVVALTANVLRDEIGRSRDAGFDGFLTKPMTLAQLSETLGAFLTPLKRQI